MKTALFVNFSTEAFVGMWDGKSKTFAPGQQVYMPDYLAKHFAKHLANRELIREGFDNATSPKFPEQVPLFMERFNKAYIPEEDEEGKSELDDLIGTRGMNEEAKKKLPEMKDKKPRAEKPKEEAIVLDVPEDEEDEEFEDKKPAKK